MPRGDQSDHCGRDGSFWFARYKIYLKRPFCDLDSNLANKILKACRVPVKWVPTKTRHVGLSTSPEPIRFGSIPSIWIFWTLKLPREWMVTYALQFWETIPSSHRLINLIKLYWNVIYLFLFFFGPPCGSFIDFRLCAKSNQLNDWDQTDDLIVLNSKCLVLLDALYINELSIVFI